MTNPENIRQAYLKHELRESDMQADPFAQFKVWWDDVIAIDIPEANAMTLSTVDAIGRPSSRIVLLKGIAADGLEFYTNYKSRKAMDMELNPHVALLFFWKELERQVRIEGTVSKVSREKSLAYFQSRPKGSQIGAWASPQSEVIPDRNELHDTVSRLEEQYRNEEKLPIPDFWGGYIVQPTLFEFWQGRDNRLHDRFQYVRGGDGWRVSRLAP
jgi:pyridoxamine 5'-phosphate oxidase